MYHMIEYIHEEPEVLAQTFVQNDDAMRELTAGVNSDRWQRLIVAGVGSSYTAALMALPALRLHSSIPVEVVPSTELDYYAKRWLGRGTIVLSVSRSGERGWVVNAQRAARAAGAFTASMSGVRDSLLAEEAELLLLTGEGPEITYSKTKSVITTAGSLMRLAFLLAPEDDALARRRLELLQRAPEVIDRTLRTAESQIETMAATMRDIDFVTLFGSGSNYGAAVEGAVKIHETSFIPTKSDDTGDALHGVLGASNERSLAIGLAASYDAEMTRAAFGVLGSARARRLAITEPGVIGSDAAEHVVTVADALDPTVAALAYLPPIQLLTYYLTLNRGLNPDAPSYMDAQFEVMLPAGRQEPELRGVARGPSASPAV